MGGGGGGGGEASQSRGCRVNSSATVARHISRTSRTPQHQVGRAALCLYRSSAVHTAARGGGKSAMMEQIDQTLYFPNALIQDRTSQYGAP